MGVTECTHNVPYTWNRDSWLAYAQVLYLQHFYPECVTPHSSIDLNSLLIKVRANNLTKEKKNTPVGFFFTNVRDGAQARVELEQYLDTLVTDAHIFQRGPRCLFWPFFSFHTVFSELMRGNNHLNDVLLLF